VIEKAIMAVVLAVIQFLASRHDQKNAAKAEVYRDLWAHAKRAYEWERDAHDTDTGADLRVRPSAGRIELQNDDPNAGGPPA
jgi:TRAP-type mannitol/chloroaromatic compound transport system substrate-binding protein